MLAQLTIRDYAIVEDLELDFRSGMTAITGETGAGKSILLGALSLCLGERADAGSVRHGARRAELSARFDISHLPEARAWLQERELDDEECLLRRTIASEGRSKAWINGTPCTIADLRALGEQLIHIHGQHAHQALLREDTHLRMLDEFAGLQTRTETLASHYRHWQQIRRRLKQAREADDETRARRQLLRYQVEELDHLALEEDELTVLEQQQTELANAEQIVGDAQFAADCCDHDEDGALSRLSRAMQRLDQLPGADHGRLAEVREMLDSARIQLEEAGRELHYHVETTELDPERLERIEERLAEVHRIARKHHVMPEEVTTLHRRLRDELNQLDDDEQDIDTLTRESETARESWRELARTVSERRHQAASELGESVQQQLTFLGMEKARFEVAVEKRETAQPDGFDHVRFLISANPGQPARPLTQVASGGELSRISLAIQVVAARHSAMSPLVFDEVDVGISGATAEIVGQLLRQLGTHGQVLCVTHLPQVAAQGHQHLHIEKQAGDDSTHTSMALLDESGRIRELARMLGGVNLSDHTLAHAREMLTSSQHSAH